MCHQVANKLRILRAFANDVLDVCLKNLTKLMSEFWVEGSTFQVKSRIKMKEQFGMFWWFNVTV